MKLPEIERHNFVDGCYTNDSKRKHLEAKQRRNLLRNHFKLVDAPILCVPELLEENIEKIKLWFQNGGKINLYSDITPFKCGLSVVTLRELIEDKYSCKVVEKKGVINNEGTEIIPCTGRFKDIVVLNEILFRVQNDDDSYSLFSALNGKEITPFKLFYIDSDYHDGLLIGLVSNPTMYYGVPQINEYVYFDQNGTIVLELNKYTSMGQFRNGLALASEERCISSWLSNPIFDYEHTYEYHKYLIDRKGKVIQDLGRTEIANSRNYLNALEPNNRIKGGIIFQADSYHHLNKYLSDNLKFDEQDRQVVSINSTENIRHLILNNYYNPEQEIKRAIDIVTYYTEHWAEIDDYNVDEANKMLYKKIVPYVYYLNSGKLELNKDYNQYDKKLLTMKHNY